MTLAGLEPPSDADGQSLLRLPDERIIFGETHYSAFATDSRWKYIYYLDGGVEHFFSVLDDPDDQHNLADSAMYQAQQEMLKEALRSYLQRHQRPVLDEHGQFRVTHRTLDIDQLRAMNNAAWRGPLRYGQGYG